MHHHLRLSGGAALSVFVILPGSIVVPIPALSLTASDLLFALGLLAIFFELVHPGAHLPGIAGFVAVIVGGLLLVQAGLWLPALAAMLGFAWLLAVFQRSAGPRALAPGLIAVAGGLLLVGSHGVDLAVSLLLTILVCGSSLVFIRLANRARRMPAQTGVESLIGSTGELRIGSAGEGRIRLHGELWNARSLSGPLEPGERVRVVEIDGLTLLVEPDKPGPQADLRQVAARTNRARERRTRA
jgi:membrane-bound serine protease (ClpP class)